QAGRGTSRNNRICASGSSTCLLRGRRADALSDYPDTAATRSYRRTARGPIQPTRGNHAPIRFGDRRVGQQWTRAILREFRRINRPAVIIFRIPYCVSAPDTEHAIRSAHFSFESPLLLVLNRQIV